MECLIILLLFIYFLFFYKKELFSNFEEWKTMMHSKEKLLDQDLKDISNIYNPYAVFGKDSLMPIPPEKKMIIPNNYYRDCLAKKYDINKNIKNKYTTQLKGFTQLEYVDQLSNNYDKYYNKELGPIIKFKEPIPVPPDYYI